MYHVFRSAKVMNLLELNHIYTYFFMFASLISRHGIFFIASSARFILLLTTCYYSTPKLFCYIKTRQSNINIT